MANERYVPTSAAPRMGTDGYRLAQARSSTDTRPGMSVPKSGNSKGGAGEPATARYRRGIPAGAIGPQFRITAKRTPYNISDPQAPTQANGRIVRSVMGSQRNFRSQL